MNILSLDNNEASNIVQQLLYVSNYTDLAVEML